MDGVYCIDGVWLSYLYLGFHSLMLLIAFVFSIFHILWLHKKFHLCIEWEKKLEMMSVYKAMVGWSKLLKDSF